MNDGNNRSKEFQRKLELTKISYEVHLTRLLRSNSAYDYAILSLSTASLGYTFSSFKQHSTPYCEILQYLIWFLLILTIILVLVSLLIEQDHTVKRIESLSDAYIKSENASSGQNVSATLMKNLPKIEGVLFCSAIILFTIFYAVNN